MDSLVNICKHCDKMYVYNKKLFPIKNTEQLCKQCFHKKIIKVEYKIKKYFKGE